MENEPFIMQQYLIVKGILGAIKGPVFSVDNNFNYMNFNEAHACIMRMTFQADIELHKNILDYITVEEDRKRVEMNLSKALKGSHLVEETFFGDSPQTGIYFEVTYAPICSDDDHVSGVAVIATDITERKRKERSLQYDASYLESLVNYASTPIMVWDSSCIVTRFNRAFEKLTGISANDVLGRNPSMLFPEEQRSRSMEFVRQAISGDRWAGLELNIQCASGKVRTLIWESSTVCTPDEISRVSAMAQGKDITEQKQTEASLEESIQKFRNLFEHSPVGNSLTGLDGVLYVNKSFCDLLGYTQQELNKKRWNDITHPDDIKITVDIIADMLDGKLEYARFQKRFLHKNGEPVWTDVSSYLQRNDKGEPQYFITAVIDITDRKKAEEFMLIAKEKAEESDRLKTAFLHNISHEIRTPLNSIVGFSGLFKTQDLTDEKREQYAEIIIQSSHQLLSIIMDIVAIATLESGQAQLHENKTDLHRLLDQLHATFLDMAKEQDLSFYYLRETEDKGLFIITDEEKLKAVLGYLVGNGIKFTKRGHVAFGYIIKQSMLEFFVKDTGIGISSAMGDSIFKRFRQGELSYTRNFGGSGLGLSISKAYVEMMGGDIWYTSEEGKGSTFYFTIPYKKEVENSTALQKDICPLMHESKTILVVDDEYFNFKLMSIWLSSEEMNVIRATNGVEAVEICRSNTEVNLVLMDVKLPLLDGLEATRLIKKMRPELPVIIQTAYVSSSEKNSCYEIGCDGFLAKPVQKDMFMLQVNKLLYGNRTITS